MAAEDVLYQDQRIQITPTRLIMGQKTQLVAELKSAFVSTVPGSSRVSCLLLVIGTAACGIVGLLLPAASTVNVEGFHNTDTQSIGVGLFVLLLMGMLLFVIGLARVFLQKPHYAVTVAGAAGQFSVLSSSKKDYIQTIVNAVNKAIDRRR